MKSHFFTGVAVAATLGLSGPLAAQETGSELRGPAAFSDIDGDEARAIALFEEMAKVITHPRCMNCHPRGDSPLQGMEMEPHQPPVARGAANFGEPGMRCSTCHGDSNVTLVGVGGIESVPGHDPWHLPPASMGWTGMTVGEICEQIKDQDRNGGKSMEELHKHNAEDGLVGWGWEPGEGREPAPGSQKIFGELTRAWIDAGAHCPG